MAELPKNIRKVGGEMVTARSPFSRRVLLPTEADLCNTLGITEEEYFQFLEGVAAKVKERPEAYGLEPDLVAGPAALAPFYAGGSLTFLGQIAVGANAPQQTLTKARCSHLPLTGQLQNL